MSDVEILPGGAWDYPPGVDEGDIDEAFGEGEELTDEEREIKVLREVIKALKVQNNRLWEKLVRAETCIKDIANENALADMYRGLLIERTAERKRIAELEAKIERLADDALAETVANECYDPLHDSRWRAEFETRAAGIDDYRRALGAKPDEPRTD